MHIIWLAIFCFCFKIAHYHALGSSFISIFEQPSCPHKRGILWNAFDLQWSVSNKSSSGWSVPGKSRQVCFDSRGIWNDRIVTTNAHDITRLQKLSNRFHWPSSSKHFGESCMPREWKINGTERKRRIVDKGTAGKSFYKKLVSDFKLNFTKFKGITWTQFA